MSYDVSIGDCSFNYTSNVSHFLYKHFPNGNGLHGICGMTGKQAQSEFSGFWESVHRELIDLCKEGDVGEPNLCARYDAPNGWGSLVGAIIFISRIQSACEKYPRRKISVWA